MELILWRHADAEEGADDLARRLTKKGEADAAAMAKWLRAQLPRDFTVVSSPAVRAQQTAAALKAKVVNEPALAPGATVPTILGVVEKQGGLVIVVGHQPDLGRAAAELVANLRAEWHIEKGAIWWFSRGGIKAVVSPELLK
jgi:phosphohistidine phosphatase